MPDSAGESAGYHADDGEDFNDFAFIALGCNVGDCWKQLADARARIALVPGVTVLHESAVERTEPVGPVPQPDFLNQMLAVRTRLAPPELLAALQEIERIGGRVRSQRWGPRTIDLDIVSYAVTTWHAPDLVVPHPELPNREFWQRELAELESLTRASQ